MAAPRPSVTAPAGPLTLGFAGRFDAVGAIAARERLSTAPVQAVAEGHREVRVDLSRASFLDSAALAALVRLRRECLEQRVRLVLVRPLAPEAYRIFRLTQLDCVFEMVDAAAVP